MPDAEDPQDVALHPTDDAPRTNYLPYPASTLSPAIVPNDLTSFKSRGASQVQKALRQQLTELQEQYEQVIDAFNWNKLIYESDFRFEPIMGETYHLYRTDESFRLSLIGPNEWHQPYVGSFRLQADGQWHPIEIAEGFDLQTHLTESGNL